MYSETDIDIEKEAALDFVESQNTIKMLSFNLGRETYCIDIKDAKEMLDMSHITKVPNTPDYIIGAMNVRGEIVTIIDANKLLGLENIAKAKENKIILTDVIGFLVGLKVDCIQGSIDVPHESIQPVSGAIEKSLYGCIAGKIKLDKQLLIMLDIKKLLFIDKLKTLESATNI